MPDNDLSPRVPPDKGFDEEYLEEVSRMVTRSILIDRATMFLFFGCLIALVFVDLSPFTYLLLIAWIAVLDICLEKFKVPNRKWTRPRLIALALLLFSLGFMTVAYFFDLPPNIASLSIALAMVVFFCFVYLSETFNSRLGGPQQLVRTPYLVIAWFSLNIVAILLLLIPFQGSYEEIHGYKDTTSVAPGVALLIIAQFILVEIYRRNKSSK